MSRQQARSEATRTRMLEAALGLFSEQGYRATSMRQIADTADLSMGNVYYHFQSKEALFERLLQEFAHRIFDADSPASRIFDPMSFPEDLESMAAACEELVEMNIQYFLLVYVDVVEFRGEHIRNFYLDTARRYRELYGETIRQRQRDGELGDIDPGFVVTFAVRWIVYYFIVEKCFGVAEHMGMPTADAMAELFKLIRRGLAPTPAQMA